MLLSADETQAALLKLTDAERAVLNFVRNEGDLCAHQLSDAERKIATRLVRRGLLNSESGSGCDQRHYH
jgi:hypothetical protein